MTAHVRKELEKVAGLLDARKLTEAEQALLKLKEKHRKDGYIDYLLGCIYYEFSGEHFSREKAVKHFSAATEADNPVEEAFVELAHIERNKNHAIRILKKGLRFFGLSEAIYFNLIRYSPSDSIRELFQEIDGKGVSSPRIRVLKAETCFNAEEFEACIGILENLRVDDAEANMVLKLMNGFCCLEIGDHTGAKSIFQELIEDDINQCLSYAPYFGAILCLLPRHVTKTGRILDQIPEETEIDTRLLMPPIMVFDFQHYLLKALGQLEKSLQDRAKLGRLRGLRGLSQYAEAFAEQMPAEGSGKLEECKKTVISDIEFSNEVFPRNTEFCQHLQWIYSEDKKTHFKAWQCAYQYCINSTEEDYFSYDFIQDTTKTNLRKIVSDFRKRVASNSYAINEARISKTLLNPIVERLFKEKDYAEVVRMSSLFSDLSLKESAVLFEFAYSFSEIGDIDSAEKYYRLHIEKYGETLNVLNNLGVIYEKRKDFDKSMSFYKKAYDLDKGDKTVKSNLQRVTNIVKDRNSAEYELSQAAAAFESESPYVKNKVLEFWQHRRDDGLVICPYRQLPQYLKVSAHKAPDFIKDLLEKKYFLRVTQHEINTQSSVYQLNHHLERILIETQESLRKEEDFLAICEKLNTSYLNNLGYDENLIANLNKLSSAELKNMLQRDILETVISLVAKCYKTTLVLSGSIIEAILLDRINAKNISKYSLGKGQGKTPKAVNKLDLCELIEVAEKENIINLTYGHLAHFLRGFRNLIHPGVEQRKSLTVSKENAELAWTVVKKLINEVR